MGRLKRLLHVSYPSTCNTQQACTLSQEMELTQLVSLVADFHQFSNDDRQEALNIALTDTINAIICFTSLAKKAGLLKYLKGKKHEQFNS